MDEQRTFGRDGRTVAFYGGIAYVYLDGQPCKQARVSGDMDLAFYDVAFLKVEEGVDGISTVWWVDNDPQLQECMRGLCALYREAPDDNS